MLEAPGNINNMRKQIGIIGGGFKPFTKGHYFLVEQAAKDLDEVILFVSTANRIRKGEMPIHWDGQMKQIWDKWLRKIMPENVIVYYVSNPTTAIYEVLKTAEENSLDNNTYVIYGDATDIPRYYPDEKLKKYYPRLFSNFQIEKKIFSRESNVDISGTKMRQYITNKDVVGFVAGLPQPIQRWGQEIFNILVGDSKY